MDATRQRYLVGALVIVSVLGLFATPAVAAITLDTSATYDGLEGDSQAISNELVLSPDDSRMTDVTVDVDETNAAFIAFDSFQQTIEPGSANINVTYLGDGRFSIDELDPNEEVTIRFKSYPRTLQTQDLATATVHVSYVQNGQDLSESNTITADMSSSPWFAYQDAKETPPTPTWILGLAAVGGIALVGGAGFGAYSFITGDEDGEGGDTDLEPPGRP